MNYTQYLKFAGLAVWFFGVVPLALWFAINVFFTLEWWKIAAPLWLVYVAFITYYIVYNLPRKE